VVKNHANQHVIQVYFHKNTVIESVEHNNNL